MVFHSSTEWRWRWWGCEGGGWWWRGERRRGGIVKGRAEGEEDEVKLEVGSRNGIE